MIPDILPICIVFVIASLFTLIGFGCHTTETGYSERTKAAIEAGLVQKVDPITHRVLWTSKD